MGSFGLDLSGQIVTERKQLISLMTVLSLNPKYLSIHEKTIV